MASNPELYNLSPLGLLLLAVDLPVLRGPISVAVIRGRRITKRWLRRWRAWRKTRG